MLVFLGLHVAIALAVFEPKLHTGGDNAMYMLLADSFHGQGAVYHTNIDPGPPTPHTKYPPVFPALLAFVQLLFGQSVLAFKALSLAATTLSVYLFCRWTRGSFRRSVWIPMCAAFAVNPIVIEYSHWILTEAAFLLLSLATLAVVERDRGERLGRWFWLGLLGGALCFYTRQIGALMIAGVALSYLAGRRWRRLLVYGGLSAAVTVPWLLASSRVTGESSPYFEEFRLRDVYAPEEGYLDFAGWVGRIFDNLSDYVFVQIPRTLAAIPAWHTSWIMDVASFLLAALAVVGLALRLRRPQATEGYFLLTAAALLLFAQTVNDVRYLMPLVPIIFVYAAGAMEAGRERIGWLRRRLKRGLPTAVFVSFFALGTVSQAVLAPRTLATGRRVLGGESYAGYQPHWVNFFQAMDWVEANTPADAVFTVRKPRLFHLHTGRSGVVYPFSNDPETVFAQVETTDYVILSSENTSVYLGTAIAAHLNRFELLFQTPEPAPTYVLRLIPEP